MAWEAIAVEQLKLIVNLLEKLNVRAEERNRRLDTLIEQGKQDVR